MPRYALQTRPSQGPITTAKFNERLTFICSLSCLMLSIALGSATSTHAQSLPMNAPVSAPWALGGMVGQVADTHVDSTINARFRWKIMHDLQTKIFETTQDVTVSKSKTADKAAQQMDKYIRESHKMPQYTAENVSDAIEYEIIPLYQECIVEGERTNACQQFEDYAEYFTSFDFRGAIEQLAVLDAGITVIDVNASPAETPSIRIPGGAASPPSAAPLILIPSLN